MKIENNKPIAKPFVKWVGGKSQLLEDIRNSITKRNRGEEFEPGGSADCL